MQFIADENVPRQVLDRIRREGYDVAPIKDRSQEFRIAKF
jgi:hypothetical protein